MKTFLSISFLALLTTSSSALAQNADAPEGSPEAAEGSRDEEARLHFQIGERALTDGRYEEALTHFSRSHELSGRPELLFNIGVANDRLRNDQEALNAYRAFLEALPDAPNRNDAERRIEILERSVAEAESGQAESGQVDVRPESVAAAGGQASESNRPADSVNEEDSGIASKWWFWTIIAVVVVGAGVGVGLAATQERSIEPVGPIHETLRLPLP